MIEISDLLANDAARCLTKPMRMALKRLQRFAPDRENALPYHDFPKQTADALIDRQLVCWGRSATGEFVIWITPLGKQVAGQIGTIGNLIAAPANRHLPKGEN